MRVHEVPLEWTSVNFPRDPLKIHELDRQERLHRKRIARLTRKTSLLLFGGEPTDIERTS